MSNEIEKIHGEVVIYTAADGNTKIDVNFIDETDGYHNSRWQSYSKHQGQIL